MSRNPFKKQTDVEFTTAVGHDEFTPEVVTEEGKIASNKEHQQSLKDALKGQWQAVCWSLVLSLSIVMVGYDNSVRCLMLIHTNHSLLATSLAIHHFKRNTGHSTPR